MSARVARAYSSLDARTVDGGRRFEVPEQRDVHGCALLFEGGGMRASYTSAAVVALLELGIRFPFVAGVSAGSSCVANYLHGDPRRAYASFTEVVEHPDFGDWKTMLQGKGLFSAHFIYQEACLPGNTLPYNFGRFEKHPSEFAILAYQARTGRSVTWHRSDVRCLEDLMLRVRASSSLPAVMPMPVIDGEEYVDGGLGVGGGIPLQAALDAGYERVFAVLTRPRGYRKGRPDATQRLLASAFRHSHPAVTRAILTRNERYNAELDRLERMADEGRAFVVYADAMSVSNGTTDVEALRSSYREAYSQYSRDVAEWLRWLDA